MAIRYLNTDLDLVSSSDLTALNAALEARGLLSLHLAQTTGNQWRASFETQTEYAEPDANIAGFCKVLEGLEGSLADDLRTCALREFNIGYECGPEPHSFGGAVSLATLRRIVEAGATLRITLYRPEKND